MSTPGSWRGVVNLYRGYPVPLQRYFEHLPRLAEIFPWDVCLAYQFSRVELAHNMSLYCGAVKLHRTDPELTWKAVQAQHLTREGFRQLFATVYGQPVPQPIVDLIASAEKVRDRMIHGKAQSQPTLRTAVCDVLAYADLFNANADKTGGLRPFGDLRGFKGRAQSLDKSASRWILKGIGLPLS